MANTSENNAEQTKVLDMFEKYRIESQRTNQMWKNTSGDVVFAVDAELIKSDVDYMLSYNSRRNSILLFPASSQPFNVNACTVDSVDVRDSAAYISITKDHIPSNLKFPIRFIRRGKRYKMLPMNDHNGIVQCDVGSMEFSIFADGKTISTIKSTVTFYKAAALIGMVHFSENRSANVG